MRSFFIALSVAAISLLASTEASANPGITGYAGKPYNGVSETCTTNCHAKGGTPPTLTVTGVPTTMTAGETAQVTIQIDGMRARTSMNAALSDGVIATKGQNTDIPFPVETPGEVAAVTPPPSGANGTYKFSFVAPQKNGAITLWVAGMSASGSGSAGDGVATTKTTIMVTGGVQPPDDDPDPPGDDGNESGTSGGSPGGTPGSDPGTPGPNTDPGGGGDDAASGSSGSGRRSSTSDPDAGGCAASPARATAGGGALALAVACAGLVLARSRRDRRARRGGGDRSAR